MGFIDRIFSGVRPAPVVTRAIDSFEDHPGLTEQLLTVQGVTNRNRTWAHPSIREALGVPSIFRAVNLISNLGASLSLEAWRDGVRMERPPRLVARPDPFTTPREFIRATIWSLATRGEAFWYIGAYDNDRMPLSLLVVDPKEIRIEWDERRRVERLYFWRNVRQPAGRIRHIVFSRDPGGTRGMGPLQLCGAAISAAIEADEWAANFFAEGGIPSVNLHSATELDPKEADALRNKWVEGHGNTARVTSGPLELREVQVSPESAQLLQARMASTGNAATMFGIPSHLLQYSQPGSSLTYQNVADVATEFVRFGLAPGYLEPIEQEMTDLLTRSTVARFDVNGIMRADIKTRFEVYKSAVDVFGPEEGAAYARREEGLAPGSVETAPVPNANEAGAPVGVPRE